MLSRLAIAGDSPCRASDPATAPIVRAARASFGVVVHDGCVPIVEIEALTKRYAEFTAVDGTVTESVYRRGILGRVLVRLLDETCGHAC